MKITFCIDCSYILSKWLHHWCFSLADEQIPWLGAGVGIIIGVIIVISDQTIAPKPTLTVSIFR